MRGVVVQPGVHRNTEDPRRSAGRRRTHLVAPLIGVKTVKNRITLSPRRHASATETQAQVRRAILRQATTDARHVNVAADGTRVVLTGTVSSFAEKRQAEIAAWAAPNVDHVDNKIVVGPVD